MPEAPLRPADARQADRLHGFAHDIKNKLGGLWECLRMLNEGPPEGLDRKELMSFAERGFFGAQRQIEDLLDDLAVDRAVHMDHQPFDLAEALRQAIAGESTRLKKKAQRTELSAPPAPVRAMGDAHWTRQSLQALVSNASKYSPRGAIITIVLDRTGDTCAVHVTDQGCGLSQEDQRAVFTRYAVLSSRSTDGEPQSRGTLARARAWARAQHGDLSATSPGTGKGSTFTYSLPAAG